MSGAPHRRPNGPLGGSVKRELKQSNLIEYFKKQKSSQNTKSMEVGEHPSTSAMSNNSEGLDEVVVCLPESLTKAGNDEGRTVNQRSIEYPEEARKIIGEDKANLLMANSITLTPITPKNSNAETSETQTTEIDFSPPLFPDEEDSCASSGEADIHLGLSLNNFKRMPECCLPLPPLKPSGSHTVLIKVPIMTGEVPRPHPESNQDKWDGNHVRMPCSQDNLYPVEDVNGRKKVESRWNLIRRSLQKPMLSSLDLEEAIMTYNSRYADKWDFSGLHAFFTDVLDHEEAHAFFSQLLPSMIDLALDLPNICTKPIPLLRRQHHHTITMSQKQISSLLANAFFCTFPRRNAQRRHSEYSSYPDINFVNLFSGSINGGIAPNKAEKLKCILHYFRQVTKREPKGTVSFSRQVLGECPKWDQLHIPLKKIGVSSSGAIEDEGSGMLEVDFANKYIGGGVLHRGCVQEEIRFVICPELVVTRLFTEVLDKTEALIVTGCERFSKYDGYAESFQWIGSYHDKTPRDSWGRRCTRLVAIDAIPFSSKREQYKPHWMTRELDKAFAGFYEPSTPPHHLPAIATGNWGCGAFGGDAQLKSLLQLMAAARAERDVMYFTFRNPLLCKEIFSMHNFLVERKLCIDDIWKLLVQYQTHIHSSKKINTSLFKFIYKLVADYNSDTEVDSSSPVSLQPSPQQDNLDESESDLLQQYTAPSTSTTSNSSRT